ncbi:MAG: TolC family protein [Verrucomicrobiota bacterium]
MPEKLIWGILFAGSLGWTASAQEANSDPVAEVLTEIPVVAAAPAVTPETPAAIPQAEPAPITLDEAVRQALSQNINIAIQRLNPAITATSELEAKAAFDATSNAEIGYSETSTPRSSEQQAADGRASTESRRMNAEVGVNKKLSTGTEVGLTSTTRNSQSTFNQFQDEYDTFAGLTFRHPLLKNSGISAQRYQIRSAQKQLEADQAEFKDQVENTIREVHFAYYDLLFAYEDYKSKEKALKTAERLMVDNQNRYELGTMTPLDVGQARSEVSQRMSGLLLAELEIQKNQNRLKRLIFHNFGDQLKQPVRLADILPDPETLPPADYNISAGLQQRNDLQSLLSDAERAGMEIKFRKNQMYPQLDLSGRIGLQGRDNDFDATVQNIIETRDEAWGVGMSITFPWGLRAEKARLKRSELQKDQLMLRIKQKEHDIIQEITEAYQEAENARLRHLNNRQARIISERTAEAEEEKLSEGISTSYTVLQLQRDVVTARTRELNSLVVYYRSLIELRRAQGLLLDDHGLIWE